MKRKEFSAAPCPIARSLDILGDWWTPLILRECMYGVHRFDEIQRWTGASRNMLARRLGSLVEQGVLERREYQSNPPRFEYHLTELGHAAATTLLAFMRFGAEWMFEGAPPIELFDRSTGKRVQPLLVDETTGRPLDPNNIFAGPGSSFPASQEVRRERFPEYFERNKHR